MVARDFVMESVRTTRSGGLLTVEFNLRNHGAAAGPVEWTLVWLDEAGARIDLPGRWAPAVLNSDGFEAISQVAPTPAAAGFRLALRKH